MLPVTRTDIMKKKEIKLTRDLLAEKYACDRGIKEFERWYPYGHVPISEVIRKLQELANTDTEYVKYVDCAKWLFDTFPPTQEPLVLNELNRKVIIHNGDIDIYSDVDGEYTIICNGNLNIKGNVKLTGSAKISAKKEVKAINITTYGDAGIWAEKTIDTINIAADGNTAIGAGKTINTINIATKNYAIIRAWKTIKAINIAAKDRSKIWAKKINTQNIMDGDGKRSHGKINLIRPSSNQQNTNTAS